MRAVLSTTITRNLVFGSWNKSYLNSTSLAKFSTNATKDNVIYLTGATGFIGEEIKKGVSGLQRFNKQFGSSHKASFMEPSARIPDDVNRVIFNAYDLSFLNPLPQVLKENVKPIMNMMDQCHSLPNLDGISVVSSAFVQQPLPFKRDPKNHIEFILKDAGYTATDIYNQLVPKSGQSNSSEDAADASQEADYDHMLPEHYKFNKYATSKHILEHLVHENYPDFPICIVRPSVVIPSRDGTHGHGIRAGYSFFLAMASQPIFRFPENKFHFDNVFVEDVAKDILDGALEHAAPAAENPKTGTHYHPILCSSAGSSLDEKTTMIDLFRRMAPQVHRYDIRNRHVRSTLRTLEYYALRLFADKRSAGTLHKMYQSYDPIFEQNWDFEPRLTDSRNEEVLDQAMANFYSHERKMRAEEKESQEEQCNVAVGTPAAINMDSK
ncbi:expressed unknown protein [Seminavis robusta]|uniref:Thioester reductase (TE) domain-containing protein n=1 Tax=Seminavis robusta TaxID=568900 RepID=A0A9N8DME0_9STRA|nr:expressed unknown protein [Seminavis robusta]|eukprot:Sro164_g073480.1 n/a (438) ;mRNA; r:12918-14380